MGLNKNSLIDKAIDFMLKRKKAIFILFLALAIGSFILSLGVDVNYSMIDYLPQEAQSTIALEIMDEEFGTAVPNANVMIKNVDVAQALEYKAELEQIEGIIDVMWLDDVADLKVPLETLDPSMISNYYTDNNALFSVTIESGKEQFAIEAIYELIGDESVGNALSGGAVSEDLQRKTASESTAIYFLIPIIIAILMFSTTSWIEPVFFLSTIGIAIVINNGTNLFFGEISYITKSVSPILQLAVSLDYAIFLLHSFEKFKKESHDPTIAMKKAIKHSFPAVAASAATTLFGFAALGVMGFRIGSDLGLNLVKGIIISFLAVMIFLPTITLCFCDLIEKTKHKSFLPSFEKIGKILVKLKIPALITMAIIIIPCFLAQSNNNFLYGSDSLAGGSRLESDAQMIEEIFGKNLATILLVPKGEPIQEDLLVKQLESEHPEIESILSYTNTVGLQIPPEYLDEGIVSQFYSENYARIVINTDMPTESARSFDFVKSVYDTAQSYYGEGIYTLGETVSLYDIKESVTADTAKVNILAMLGIAFVILVSFKSLSLPLFLILAIQTAVWANCAVPYFLGDSLNYIGFLIINTVQLGATIDYAILLSSSYMKNRQEDEKYPAMKKTLKECIGSVFISASILASAGFFLFLTESNPIISELGLLMGRGTILSVLSVLCALPALLIVFDKFIEKTSYNPNFMHKGVKK